MDSNVLTMTPRFMVSTSFKTNRAGGCSWGFSPMGMKLKRCVGSMKLKSQFAHQVMATKSKHGDQDVEVSQSFNFIKDLGDAIHPLIEKLGFFKLVVGSEPVLNGSIKMVWLIILARNPLLLMIIAAFSFIKPFVDVWDAIETKTIMIMNPTGSFDDLVGLVAEKALLREIVLRIHGDDDLKKSGVRFHRWVRFPRWVLLHGPQETGKTSLVHAVAREAKVPLISVSAKDLADDGTGATLVRYMFCLAIRNAPCIIFIDDLEAISRGLCELPIEMERLGEDAGVVVMAATRRKNIGDLTMNNARWFSKIIRVDKPDEEGRRTLFSLYLKDAEVEDREAICSRVASQTEGFTATDPRQVAEEAGTIAGYAGRDVVSDGDVAEALRRVTPYTKEG